MVDDFHNAFVAKQPADLIGQRAVTLPPIAALCRYGPSAVILHRLVRGNAQINLNLPVVEMVEVCNAG